MSAGAGARARPGPWRSRGERSVAAGQRLRPDAGSPGDLAGSAARAGSRDRLGATGEVRVQPLNLHKETLGTEGFAAAARARMRNGDCAGALDPFDQALVSSVDPTLRRDRGLCHEKLGDTFPAIDDFRVYLTASPDAADADNIRQRLARLEMDVLQALVGRRPRTTRRQPAAPPSTATPHRSSAARSGRAR